MRIIHFFDNWLNANNIKIPANANGQNLLKKVAYSIFNLVASYVPMKHVPNNPIVIKAKMDIHNKWLFVFIQFLTLFHNAFMGGSFLYIGTIPHQIQKSIRDNRSPNCHKYYD